MAESTSKLRSQVKALTNVNGSGGVDILADEKTFRSTYDIMSDIAGVWQNMSDIDQSALLELLAGKVRSNQVAALLSNFDQAEKAMKTSQNAEGTMDKVHRAWMDSVEARKAQFEAAQETLSMTVMPANTLKGLYQTGTSALGLLNTVIGGTGSLGFGAGIFGVANVLRSGGGNIAAGLGNMLGIHRDTINGGFTRGNLDFINRYNEAFSETGNKQEAFALATQGANKALDSYTMSLYGSTSGLIDARKVTTGFGSAIKSFAKNALVGVGTFAAMEGAAFLMNKAWQFVDSQILNRGETLANNAATAHANYEAVQNEANTTAEKVQTTQEQINELRSKPALTPSESQQLVDLESQMRSLAFMQRLLDAQAQQAAAEGLSAWNESYADQVKNQLGAESLFNDEMFVSPEQLFGDNADSIEEVAKWFDQAVSKAYEAMQAAEYGSHEYNAAEDAMRQLNEASESLRHDYDNAGEFFETGRGRDAVKLAAAYTDAKQLSTEQRSQGRVEALQEKYNEQYADKTLAAVRAQAEALAEHVGQMGDMSRFSPEAVAAGYATAKGLYDQLAQSAEQAGDAVGQLSDIDAVRNFEGIWTSFKSAVSGRMMDLQDSVQTAFTDYAGAGYKGDTTYLKQALTGYMALRRALEPNGDYDALRAVLKGSSLEDAVGSLDALAAESEITAEDIKDLKVDGVVNAGGKLQKFLELAGLSVEDFAGMVNAAAKQAADRSGVSGSGAPAKVDIYGERQASVAKALAAQDTGSKVWSASGYTGGMTEADYQSLVDLGDESYLAAVEYAQGGLFFNKDAFDRIVQDKYKEELAGLKKDVVSAQEKYRDAANRIVEQASKAKAGGEGFDSAALSQAYTDLSSATKELSGYRRMQAQLQYNMSDYVNWLNNKNGPESGDMYSEIGQAAQAILAGQKSGLIGTRQFEAAMRFYTGQENFDVNSLSKKDWELLRGAAGVDSTGAAKEGLSKSTLFNTAKELRALGILGENYGFVKPTTMDEVARRYNEAYGANTNAQYMEGVFKALNDYIQNPNDKYDLSAMETPEAKAAADAYDKFMQAAKDYNDNKISADELMKAANDLDQATNNAMLTSKNSELAAQAAKDVAERAAAEEQAKAEEEERKGQANIANQQLDALNKIADYTQKQYELQAGTGGGEGSEGETDVAASQAEAEAAKKEAIAKGLEADAAQDKIDELRKAEREEAAEQAEVEAYANAQRAKEMAQQGGGQTGEKNEHVQQYADELKKAAEAQAKLDAREAEREEAAEYNAIEAFANAQRGQLAEEPSKTEEGTPQQLTDLNEHVQQFADGLNKAAEAQTKFDARQAEREEALEYNAVEAFANSQRELEQATDEVAQTNESASFKPEGLSELVQQFADGLQKAAEAQARFDAREAEKEEAAEYNAIEEFANSQREIAQQQEASQAGEDTSWKPSSLNENVQQFAAELKRAAEAQAKADAREAEREEAAEYSAIEAFANSQREASQQAETAGTDEGTQWKPSGLSELVQQFADGLREAAEAAAAAKEAEEATEKRTQAQMEQDKQTLSGSNMPQEAKDLAQIAELPEDLREVAQTAAEMDAAVKSGDLAKGLELGGKFAEQLKTSLARIQQRRAEEAAAAEQLANERQAQFDSIYGKENQAIAASASAKDRAAIQEAQLLAELAYGGEQWDDFDAAMGTLSQTLQQAAENQEYAEAQAVSAAYEAKKAEKYAEQQRAEAERAKADREAATEEAEAALENATQNYGATKDLTGAYNQLAEALTDETKTADDIRGLTDALNDLNRNQNREQANTEKQNAIAEALQKDAEEQAAQAQTQSQAQAGAGTGGPGGVPPIQEASIEVNGDVDLNARPTISGKAMQEAGWTDVPADDYATVYTSSYSGNGNTVLATPIGANGELYTPEQLDDYAWGLLEAYDNLSDVFANDSLGLILAGMADDSEAAIDRLGEYAEALHDAQEEMYGPPAEAGSTGEAGAQGGQGTLTGQQPMLTETDIDNIYDRADEVARNVKDFTDANLDGNEALMAAGMQLANYVAGLGSEISPQELSQLTDKTQAMLDEAMGVVKEQENAQEAAQSTTEQTGAGEQAPTSATGAAGTEKPDAMTSASIEPEIPGRKQEVSVDAKNATIEVPSGNLGISSDLRRQGQSALFGLEDSSYAAGMRPTGESLSATEMQAVNNAITSLSKALTGDNATALSDAMNTAQQIMSGNIVTEAPAVQAPAPSGGGGGGGGVATGTATIKAEVETPTVPTPDVSPVQIPVEVESAEVPQPDAPSVVIPVTYGDPGGLSVPSPPSVVIPVSWGDPGPMPGGGGGGGLSASVSIGAGVAVASGTEHSTAGRYLVDERGAELIEHVSQGTYELGTNGGARFTKLNAGDIVHTAKETKRILGRGGATSGKAFGGGGIQATVTSSSIQQPLKLDIGPSIQVTVTPPSSTGSDGNLTSAKSAWDAEKWKNDSIRKAMEESQKKSQMGRNPTGSGDATGIGKDFLEWLKKLIDWIPTYLSVLKKKTTAFVNATDDAIHYLSQNKLIDDAIGNISEEIKANMQATIRYAEFLKTMEGKGISEDIAQKVRNGTIDIKEYADEDTVKSIQAYQEYWNKLVACREALQSLNAQMEALSKQKLDNVVSYFDRIDGLLKDQQRTFESLLDMKKQYGQELTVSDYTDSMSVMEQMLANARKEEAALVKELQEQLGVGGDLVNAILKGGREVWDDISEHIKKNTYNNIVDELKPAAEEAEKAAAEERKAQKTTTQSSTKVKSVTKGTTTWISQNGKLIKVSGTGKTLAESTSAANEKSATAGTGDGDTSNPDIDFSTVDVPVEPITDEEIIDLGKKLGLVMADGSEEALANFETIKSLLTTSWEHPLAIGSDTWYEYMSTLENLRESIYSTQTEIGELKDEMADIPLTNLKTGFAYLETIKQNLEDTNSLLDAQGSSKFPNTFESLISVGMKQIENLQEQNKLIQEQMDSLDPLSEKYQELRSSLNGNLDTIADIRKNQEEWNDEIIDLQIDRLKKQNDTYKEQLRLMQALDDLDKARQRRLLVYHEEGGFRYEADEDALEDAQEAANDAIYNNIVSGLERSKENNNIYGPLGERLISGNSIVDSLGNTLVPVTDKLSGLNFEPYYQSIVSGAEQSGLLTSMLNSIDMAKLLEASIGGNVSIDISGMTLNEVNNVKELGDAIIDQLPGYLLQALYQKGA